jgi:hypothetical protein
MLSVELRRNGDEVTQIMLGPISCTETSIRNYHYTLCNIPEGRISQGDMITMLIIQFYSCSHTFPLHKATRHAPQIFMQSVHLPLLLNPFTLKQSHTFEGHFYAFSYSPYQSAIGAWGGVVVKALRY